MKKPTPELSNKFLASVLADRSLNVAEATAVITQAREVAALCHLCDHPAADLINRRVTLNQAREAIRAGAPMSRIGREMTAAKLAISAFAADFWKGKK